MYIVDYTNDYFKNKVKTIVFEGDNSIEKIITFVAENSKKVDFSLKRINKYESGKLRPYSLELSRGRLVVEATPMVEKS